MQNYIKIQDELKGVPDAVLAGYMKNPTGEAPQFLVSSEIQRRTDMRAKFQNNHPQSTVADDLEQKLTGGLASLPQEQQAPQEDQGIAGLPTDMPEVSAAGGGIIAFDDGGYIPEYEHGGIVGDIPRFANKGSVDHYGLTQESFDKLSPEQQQQYYASYYGGAGFKNAGKALWSIPAGIAESFVGVGTDINNMLLPVGKALGVTHPTAKSLSQPEYIPEMQSFPRSIEEFRAGLPPTAAKTTAKPAVAPTAVPTGAVPETKAPAATAAPTAAPRVARPPVAPNAPATINDGLGNILPDQSSAYKGLLQAEQTPAEKMAELQDLIGVDPNKEIMQARLAKMDESAQKSSEQAPWMAALQAGLGMMSGTSPYAMTNIGAGALMGTKDYAAAQDKADANEEKRFNLSNQLGKADYDAKVAAATYGENSSQAIKTQNKATQLAGLTAAAQVAKDKADNVLKQKELKINEEHYKNADAVARIVANKPPAEVSLIERYMNDPKFALASDKINLSKKESQALQDMRDLFIKAKTTIGSPYKDTTFSDFVKMFNPSAQTELPSGSKFVGSRPAK